MCGVAGLLEFRHGAFADDLPERMAQRLQHRGPDGQGILRCGPITLVHRRLAILDLSSQSHQPYTDLVTGDALSYNGEIYNFQDLRKTLVARGRIFKSTGDTEVLFQGLQVFGLEFLSQLDGDFAFAFWHNASQTLWLARDRFGVKPLYWRQVSNGLVFASEVKAILEEGSSSSHISDEAIENLMARRYAPAPKTPWRDIFKVEPGTAQVWSREKHLRTFNYWQMKAGDADQFPQIFAESVRSRLQSDVPVGCFLSGGIDSSVIADQAVDFLPHGMTSFTYRIPDGSKDVEQARSLADQLGFDHRVVQHPSQWNESLGAILYHLEEPLGDSTLLPTYHLCASVSQTVKVALSGEGADELFGGYAHQSLLHRTRTFRTHLPDFGRRAVQSFLPLTPLSLFKNPFYPSAIEPEMVERLARLLGRSPELAEDHLAVSSLFSARERKQLLLRSLGDEPLIEDNLCLLKQAKPGNPELGLLALDTKGWLSDYGLHRMDRLSMAHGLEVRVPFVNHHLIEAVFSSSRLFSWQNRKPLLRNYARTRPRIRQMAGRAKHPLFFPVERLEQKQILDWSKNVLQSSRMGQFEILNPPEVTKWLNEFRPSFLSFKKLFWLTTFQLWSEMYLTNSWRLGPINNESN